MNKPHWRIIIDERTLMKFSEFFVTKNGMVKLTCKLLQEQKDIGKPVTHLRMDNAGENIKLMDRCKSLSWKLGIRKFELTAQNTPQQNALTEVGFATIVNQMHAMLHCANIPDEIRHIVVPMAMRTATNWIL